MFTQQPATRNVMRSILSSNPSRTERRRELENTVKTALRELDRLDLKTQLKFYIPDISYSHIMNSLKERAVDTGDAEEGGDESTIRPHSVLTIRSLKNTTTAKIVACKTAFSSLAIRTRRSRPPLINFNRPEEPQNTEDFLNFDESPPVERKDDDVSLEDLFNAVKLQDDSFPISDGTSSVSSTNRRKQILIKEPDDSSRIYFDYRTKKRLPLPFLNRGSKPRLVILRKSKEALQAEAIDRV
ncbi:hypothetical protein ANCDUO_21672 [Ancylostoma duodenale]|uniref:Uncharacterized protein n=1 Tax=Ancylostoma duodenale TaxID=51022 RepID=A0A0C2FTN4_9BILA|nr:hypothetical protein ANCDUO_21672 [Ancylostoma duodenale]